MISISSFYQVFNYIALIDSFAWYIAQLRASRSFLIVLIYQENIRIFCFNSIFYDMMNSIVRFSADSPDSSIISIEYTISCRWMIAWIYINFEFLSKRVLSKLLFIINEYIIIINMNYIINDNSLININLWHQFASLMNI